MENFNFIDVDVEQLAENEHLYDAPDNSREVTLLTFMYISSLDMLKALAKCNLTGEQVERLLINYWLPKGNEHFWDTRQELLPQFLKAVAPWLQSGCYRKRNRNAVFMLGGIETLTEQFNRMFGQATDKWWEGVNNEG